MVKNLLLISLVLCATLVSAQEQRESKTPTPNYRLASRFSPKNVRKLMHSTSVTPWWLTKSNRFWYEYSTSKGKNYYIVDVDNKTRSKLFDNAKMARWLSEITKDPYDARHLPRFNFKFTEDETAIRFRVTSNEEVEVKKVEKKRLSNDSLQREKAKVKRRRKEKPKMENKVYHLEYRLGGNKLTVIDNKKEDEKSAAWANVAPDSSIVVFARNHNLYCMDKENFKKALVDDKDTTIVEHQWTKDGVKNFGYGRDKGDNVTVEKNKNKRKSIFAFWSDDSKKFVVQRTDNRHIKDLWVINSTKRGRPTLETFKYHMAGEQEFAKTTIEVFDVPSKEKLVVKLDSTVQQSVRIYARPFKPGIVNQEYGATKLASKKGKIYFQTISRDRKRLDIHVADINTGEVKNIIKDHANTYIEVHKKSVFRLLNNEKEIIFYSERDGWAHFYLYDIEGNLKRQITRGEFHADKIQGIDEKKRVLYFTAQGVNKELAPYYTHLYLVNFDGTGFKVLNPGDYTSSAYMSANNSCFVTNYSTVSSIPKSELRNSKGGLIMSLEEADLSQLFAAGYKFSEPFKVKADDGITDLYGVMYKPYDFDETKKYPIIEYVYPGPQMEAVNKSFSNYFANVDQLAQIGFVVVTVGNRGGHPNRSKWSLMVMVI